MSLLHLALDYFRPLDYLEHGPDYLILVCELSSLKVLLNLLVACVSNILVDEFCLPCEPPDFNKGHESFNDALLVIEVLPTDKLMQLVYDLMHNGRATYVVLGHFEREFLHGLGGCHAIIIRSGVEPGQNELQNIFLRVFHQVRDEVSQESVRLLTQGLETMVVGLELVHIDSGIGWLNDYLGLKHILREVLGDFIDVQTHYDI